MALAPPTFALSLPSVLKRRTHDRSTSPSAVTESVHYDGDVSTKTADLTTVKTMLNSVKSTPNDRFMTGDIKDFYLETPMEAKDYAYMRITVTAIPNSIMTKYKLAALIHKGFVSQGGNMSASWPI
jgi:hypothetical protein